MGGYSNTFSDQRGGGVSYFTADLGYNFLNSPRYRIGAFVGNNFWHESYDAFGCTQQATNWGTCVPTVPPTSTSQPGQRLAFAATRLGRADATHRATQPFW
jgi:hypothetical protein